MKCNFDDCHIAQFHYLIAQSKEENAPETEKSLGGGSGSGSISLWKYWPTLES